MKVLFLVSSLLFFTEAFSQAVVFKKMNECSSSQTEIFEKDPDSVLSLHEFPSGLYLVRSISQSLERSETEKYYSFRRLISSENKSGSICYEGKATLDIKTQAFVPTMIDMTRDKSWGDSFWSLSFSSQKQVAALQAQRSLIPVEKYKEKLMQQGFKIETRQKSHKEFELRLVRTISSLKETIVILYDQI